VAWPAPQARTFLDGVPAEAGDWVGSLIKDQRDASGLLYRRNRYYDPYTGQFTQEDPIGVAGGMNLYGFAAGDPVNAADPFGLNPCLTGPNAFKCIREAAAAANQAALTLAATVAGAMSALLPDPSDFALAAIVPVVRNAKLGNLVSDLFKGARGDDVIGTGSTADALRNERITGLPTKGVWHTNKSEQYVRALDKWLKKNPDASDYDRLVAQSLRDDLQNALRGH
jgi:RHS repeat-associated protein